MQQQRQQHVRVRPTPAHTAEVTSRVEGGGVRLADHLKVEPDQMIRRQPISHVRRQQELLVP